ncbi:MAG TPA: MalY/PatB family protein [Clostridia bacterium]|nr:MalY/PatB family protein [Clostridia bacterium]
MSYDFDEIINRKNTNSIKYDFAAQRGKPEGVLPLWVADMDFRTPDCITEALVNKSRHGIFGYSESGQDYFDILQKWFFSNHGWTVEPEWLVKTPGVIYAICTAIGALTEEGDAVMIQQPVYYPFEESIIANDRKMIVNQLIYSDGRYLVDFEDFEKKIRCEKVRMFILCSPHNPVGRVWTEEELVRMGNICRENDVIVISDEIHSDFVYPGHKHLVFANIRPEFVEMSITCTAPTKTFNLAGLQISNIFIPDDGKRRRIKKELVKSGYSQLNVMGITACRAAYAGGYEWLEELRSYLYGNLGYVREFLRSRIPQVKLVEPEGTYLVWLDFNGLGLDHKGLEDLITNKAGLWLDAGSIFGAGGEGFQRINIACPRSILEKALSQLERAIDASIAR